MLVSSICKFFCGRTLFSAICLVLLLISFGCSSSSKSNSNQTAAPSNLVYPAATITVTTGQAIPASTPTVTGSVTSYSISPALPAGLALNSTTGVISGTPTASSPTTTYTITATNSGGATTTTIQLTVSAPLPPPSGLSYPQTTINAIVGQAIATDTPTVTGTVSSYTVAPALPAGLSINATTGTISGTPTVVATQASYTVTAVNASGSTTATVQITVNSAVPAPSALTYPQTNVNAAVGESVIPNIPSYTGTVTMFTVNPALPAGLLFDSSTGAITGTPTAQSTQTTYTVTASNQGGNTTATVSIAVNKQYATVMELGHGGSIRDMHSTANRLLSHDANGHWVLWDAAADSQLASGDQYPGDLSGSTFAWPVDIEGTTVAIGQTDGVEIRSAADGHFISLIAAPLMIDPLGSPIGAWWKLASDGSYLCAGSSSGLAAWSTSGQQLLSRPGNYSSVQTFASPGQIQIANGPAGQNVIETVTVGNGASATGPAFSGTFNSWFLDGQRFLTNTGTTVWTYSASSVEQGIISLPTIRYVGGVGNWIYSYQDNSNPPTVSVYAVGANSPSATYSGSTLASVIPSGSMLAILADGSGAGTVVDLSGSSPVKTDFTTPIGYLSAFAATSASKWFAANRYGVIVDGASTNAAKTLSRGEASSIAGGTNQIAIATADGLITYLNPATPTSTGTIAFSSSKLALSSDGTVLAAAATSQYAQYSPDRTLKIFSLPSGTTTGSIPYTVNTSGTPYLLDFSLSGSGTVLGQLLEVYSPSQFGEYRTVGPVAGGPSIWSDPVMSSLPLSSGAPLISPDGTLISVTNLSQYYTSNIYQNGALVTAIPDVVVGWIDNNTMLVNTYSHGKFSFYLSAAIYDATGAEISTSSIPELSRIQALGTDQIYSPVQNKIFSLSSGQAIWSATVPSTDGAVAGSYIVFVSGNRILTDTH